MDAGADGDEIIAHHDLAPWNLVIGERRLAFIDRDTAAPGTRLWDLAYAIHGFVPLSADPALQCTDASGRLRVIADAYGLSERERLDIVPLLARRTRSMHDFLARQAAAGAQPWTRLWYEGHGDTWQADTDYITEREHEWRQALLRLPAAFAATRQRRPAADVASRHPAAAYIKKLLSRTNSASSAGRR